MKLVLTGPKCSGKSKIGRSLAESLSIPFYETDLMIEHLFKTKNDSSLSCRAICAQFGEDYFRSLEREIIGGTLDFDNCVISTGGSTMLNKDSRMTLRTNSILILITASIDVLLKRLSEKEIPAFLNNKSAQELFAARAALVTEVIYPYADIVINSSKLDFEETFKLMIDEITSFIASLNRKLSDYTKIQRAVSLVESIRNSASCLQAEKNIDILKAVFKA
jgi:shikimate kinase